MRGIINAVVSAVITVGGAVSEIMQAIQQPVTAQAAAPGLQPAARTGPPVCAGKLCAEYLTDGPQQGRLKVTFTPENELPGGFVGVVSGPGLELTGKSAVTKGPNSAYTGFFDVGNKFRKDQQLCTTIFAVNSSKRGAQLGKEACVKFLNDPQ